MITKDDDLLGTLIHDVAHLLRFEIDKRLKPHNLTRVKWLALGILKRHPTLTQVELAEKLELGAASVGRLVDRLEERGFVTREADPNDRRSYRLHLTEEAISLLRDLDGLADSLRADTLDNFSEDEVETLNAGLSKLKRNLKAHALAALAVTTLTAHKISLSSNDVFGLAAAV